MKYLYKQTGMIVESSEPLDSMFFEPAKETVQPEKEKTAQEPAPKKTTRKTPARTAKK